MLIETLDSSDFASITVTRSKQQMTRACNMSGSQACPNMDGTSSTQSSDLTVSQDLLDFFQGQRTVRTVQILQRSPTERCAGPATRPLRGTSSLCQATYKATVVITSLWKGSFLTSLMVGSFSVITQCLMSQMERVGWKISCSLHP